MNGRIIIRLFSHKFTIRQILEKCEAKNKEIGMIFLDLEKAYDNVPRKLLWNVLVKSYVDIPFINTIKEIYDKASVTSKWEPNYQENLRLLMGSYKGVVCLQPFLRFISG